MATAVQDIKAGGRGDLASARRENELVEVPRALLEQLLAAARAVEPAIGRGPKLVEPAGGCPAALAEGERLELARTFYQLRRRRGFYFGEDNFSEPAWDMLLDLYVAELEQRPICVSSACIGAAAPQTTGLRWLCALESQGLIFKEADASDLRRSFVRLTPLAILKMERLIDEARVLIGLPGPG